MDLQDSVISLNNLVPIIRTTADTYNQVINVLGFSEGVDILLLGIGGYGKIRAVHETRQA